MADRWWCIAGDVLWSAPGWRLVFLSDDGSLWWLNIGPEGANDGRANLHWDYAAESIYPELPPSWDEQVARGLYDRLRRASPRGRHRMSELQQKVLDVVSAAVIAQDPTVTAKWLRKKLAPKAPDAAEALCPRYLAPSQGIDGDCFEATIAGLLESSTTGTVSPLIEALRSARRE